MVTYLALNSLFLLVIVNVIMGVTQAVKLKPKSHSKHSAAEKKTDMSVPVPYYVPMTKMVPHPCVVPVPVGPELNLLNVHIHEENPCKNGGIMHVGRNCAFRCLCRPQFGGSFCEEHLFCYWNPCKNGGTCRELGNGFECKCKDGLTGRTCEERNHCQPNPCPLHAKCVETKDTFKCICEEGYKGKYCNEVDPCFPSPCKNNGVCRDINGVANCECKPPYKGVFCTDILICFRNPCHNGASCVENPKAPCTCKRGYIGTYCEEHVCYPNPCTNGGTCRVIESQGKHKWNYKCVCPPGFTGELCHIPHPCAVNICLNGGTCIDAHTSEYGSNSLAVSPVILDFYCQCLAGFTGKKCETKICDLCDKNAECINNLCVCKKNFIGNGFYCKEIDDPCKPNPCKNKGTCVLGPDISYSCKCAWGYCGPHCESICNPCLSSPCKNNGTCRVVGNAYICSCPPGFTGSHCESPLPNPCEPNPCLNKGTCERILEKNDYRCICRGKFTGKNCEVCDCPKAKPIASGLIAIDQKCDLDGECYCPTYKGKETSYIPGEGCVPTGGRPCDSDPCQNGGQCKEVGTLQNFGYVCLCPKKYYGINCECSECTCNFPCLNNGICEDIATHIYKCTCPAGFTGTNCEAVVPTVRPSPCLSNPCLNDGTCVARRVGYDCLCTQQFTGPHCGVDKCRDCDVNADCVSGRCRCIKGYIGTGYVCEKEEKECKKVICPVHHYCFQGVCICLPGFVC